jgi:hypothetical protein
MGFWKAIAYAMDRKMAQEADKQQAQYDAQHGGDPGIISSFFANRRGDRRGSQYADQYWEDSRLIDSVPEPWQKQDLGHTSGCSCFWCSR